MARIEQVLDGQITISISRDEADMIRLALGHRAAAMRRLADNTGDDLMGTMAQKRQDLADLVHGGVRALGSISNDRQRLLYKHGNFNKF